MYGKKVGRRRIKLKKISLIKNNGRNKLSYWRKFKCKYYFKTFNLEI
jgi:hypothetical protein